MVEAELARLTERYSQPCDNPMCIGGDSGTPTGCKKCQSGRIWMLGVEWVKDELAYCERMISGRQNDTWFSGKIQVCRRILLGEAK